LESEKKRKKFFLKIIEARANYEDILGFGYNSTFEVGSSSGGNKEPGPHGNIVELEAVGLDP
jgi:hypothetical protein